MYNNLNSSVKQQHSTSVLQLLSSREYNNSMFSSLLWIFVMILWWCPILGNTNEISTCLAKLLSWGFQVYSLAEGWYQRNFVVIFTWHPQPMIKTRASWYCCSVFTWCEASRFMLHILWTWSSTCLIQLLNHLSTFWRMGHCDLLYNEMCC